MNYFRYFFLFLLCLILLSPLDSLADGVFFPPPDYYIGQASQQGVIIYDKGIETLILSSTFYGDAKDFGWVIPTPTRPEIDQSTDEIFIALSDLTGRTIALNRKQSLLGDKEEASETKVKIVETKQVGIYDVKVILASEASSLAKWLSDNGFQFPKESSYVLEDYVQYNWFYTVAKVRPELIWPGMEKEMKSGHISPLKLTFKTDKIVFPLKISSLIKQFEPLPEMLPKIFRPGPIPNRQVMVTLYVFADKQKVLPGFKTLYTAILNPAQIKNLAYNNQGDPWFTPDKRFVLTKLSRSMTYSEMNHDLYLRDAQNGLSVALHDYHQWLIKIFYFLIIILFWIISPMGLIFIVASVVHFLTHSKAIRLIAWLAQFFTAFLWLIIMFWLILIRLALIKKELVLSNEIINIAIISGCLVMLSMIVTAIFQIIHHRREAS